MSSETVIFTDIYPVWELPWYQTPFGYLIFCVMALAVVAIGGAVWFWRRPYRKMAKLGRLIECDAQNAPDYCSSYIEIVCAVHKIPVHAQMTEQEQICLLKNRFAHPEWDFLRETLVRARYGKEEASRATRERWVAFLRKSARGMRD